MGSNLLRSLSLRAALVAACFFACAAFAQVPPTPPGLAVVYPATANLAVTTASARVALPATNAAQFNTVCVFNAGTSPAYMALGTSTVTATTSGIYVPASRGICVWAASTVTNVAAITATSTATLIIYQANGPVPIY